MDRQSPTRFANGVISAFIVCFFLVHGLLGSIFGLIHLDNSHAWIAWIGVAVAAAHVLVSVVTSYQQLTDKEFPPSARKKRHLILKWTTGVLLIAVVCVHIILVRDPDALVGMNPVFSEVTMSVVSALLAWHICVGMKSLLTDIGVDQGLMTPLRALVCALAAAYIVMAIVAMLTF